MDLTEAERKLVEAARKGEVANYAVGQSDVDDPAKGAEWGENRTIRAEVIYALATGVNQEWRAKGVWLNGARIKGQLDFTAASIKVPMALTGCHIQEPLILDGASAPMISLNGSRVPSISAMNLTVAHNLLLADGFTALRGVQLHMARIGGQLNCGRGTFGNLGEKALDGKRLTVGGDVFLNEGFMAKGEVRLLDAKIDGLLDCAGGTFENADGDALLVDRVRVGGSVILSKATAKGEVSLGGAKIDGQLVCSGGTFENPKERALSADGLAVGGGIFLNEGFTAKGEVWLRGAKVDGQVSCQGAWFDAGDNASEAALTLEAAIVSGDFFLDELKEKPKGNLDLMHTKVGRFMDDRRSWPEPGKLWLDGFQYDSLPGTSPTDVGSRLKWIELQPKEYFSFQPYDQLAAVLRRMGDEIGARKVYAEKQRTLRKRGNLPRSERAWSWFLDRSLYYGYQIWRPLIGAVIIVLFGTFLFWNWFWNMEPLGAQPTQAIAAAPLQSVMPARILAPSLPGPQPAQTSAGPVNVTGSAKPRNVKPDFEPPLSLDHVLFSFFYSLDVFLPSPIGTLRQKSVYPLRPRHPDDWWFYVYESWDLFEMLSGWAVAALIAAALAGLARRGERPS